MKPIVKFLSVLSVSLLVTTGATALPALYVHYDASDAANVTVDVSDVVQSLTDLSAPLPQLMMPPKQVEQGLCSILIQGT